MTGFMSRTRHGMGYDLIQPSHFGLLRRADAAFFGAPHRGWVLDVWGVRNAG
jgi:hypothetical protein